MRWFEGFLVGALLGPLGLWFALETLGKVHHYGNLVCIW